MNSTPTVFLIDDEPAILDSISLLIKSAGLAVKTYLSAEAFLEDYTVEQSGCIVLDYHMEPGMNGLELQAELLRRQYAIPIIFLSAKGDIPTTVRAMQSGAVNFLVKPPQAEDLLGHIQKAIIQDVLRLERQNAQHHNGLSNLTKREHEIAELLIVGKTNKEIARILDISPRTVENHRAHIMEKTQCANLVELVHLFERTEPASNPNGRQNHHP